ncbi:MAG: TonB-dependent receptor, partial [Planctomycetes bacterium]|nr:TonB-dependent receptor [Planctomycetota bacterium]
LSALSAVVIDPVTGKAFPGNQIPLDRISPAALALLRYYPAPNQPGDRQNYYYSTTTGTSSDDVNFRLIRSFGTTTRQPGRPGARAGGMAGGGRGGGRGGMQGGTNLNVGVHYQRSESAQNNPFPTITGTNRRTGWDVPVNFSFSKWGLLHTLNFQFNRSTSRTTNASAYVENVAGNAGITGVSTDPFDWGVPTLSLSSVSGLRDINPGLSRDQTVTISDAMVKMRGRHSIRFGGDFRDQRLESWTNASARGSFVYTGLYAGGGTARVSGLDFADLLLGLAQQASVQYGPGLERFRTRSFSLYVQDDWRVRTDFTVNAGLRYEYQSPYREVDNRLVNLDVAPDFTAAVPVIAGQAGPFTGVFPSTIVEPDRNNLSPRIGVAWRPQARTVIRGGYGINHASVPYLSFAQRMAGQPPFAVTDTRIGTASSPIPITAAFSAPSTATTTNNFGVDRHYRLGYVQIWNVDLQRDLNRTLSMGVAYTGTRGSQLDIQRAPNRGPSGLLIPGVQPFIWESSGGRSIMHALSLRVSRRLAQGISGGATYTISTSKDNASTIGGGQAVVAQNDQDLEAEWGRSSFDQRHRFSASFSWELPFGPNRRWLTGGGVAGQVLGGWILNGALSMASGNPFTARVVGDTADVSRGTNGTLRADYTGAPIALDNPTTQQFFNTTAFAVPATGTFGNAGRNTINGPGSRTLN